MSFGRSFWGSFWAAAEHQGEQEAWRRLGQHDQADHDPCRQAPISLPEQHAEAQTDHDLQRPEILPVMRPVPVTDRAFEFPTGERPELGPGIIMVDQKINGCM